ncbi:MAG: hypothetical protein AMS24_03335 [Chlamydiae bacterium SM23_39]|nr:MAG: hypothetical protein AMS24_03335 [Chlamydiae bacterium SM23_39]
MKNLKKMVELDSKEITLPDTTYIRDIEGRVFQGIVLRCLDKIEGIGFICGTLIDSILGREAEKIKGIYVEQDQKNHSIFIKVEVNIKYGISIPEKSEEIQNKIIEEITNLTGLHVSGVHVIFKDLIAEKKEEEQEIVS